MSTPRTIMPKFLWMQIIDYLPLPYIITLSDCHSQFVLMIDWENCFKNKRKEDIAFVFDDGWTEDQFWCYACKTYVGSTVYADHKTNLKIIFNELKECIKSRINGAIDCKIYMKTGQYYSGMDLSYDGCNLIYSKCTIELIGDNTTICTMNENYGQCCRIHFAIDTTFTIRHVDFVDVRLLIDGIINASTLIIDHCKFNHRCEDFIFGYYLDINYVNCVMITNCVFSHKLFDMYKPMIYIFTKHPMLSITDSMFTCKQICDIDRKGNIDSGCITFANNQILCVIGVRYIFRSLTNLSNIIHAYDNVDGDNAIVSSEYFQDEFV